MTVSYMSNILTIRLDEELQGMLDRACGEAGRTRSDFAREALRRQLALARFEDLRRQAVPHATQAGFVTDEDVFAALS